jgi:signal transduction histidine kinase
MLDEDAPRMVREMTEAMARREPGLAFGFRLRRADGVVRWIEGKAAFTYAADGAPLRMVGVNVDVTERHEAGARLRASEARLASVFQQAPVAVAVTYGREAGEMVFELANPHYLELVPPGQAVVGQRVCEVFPDVGPVVLGALQRVLDTGEPFAATEFLVRIDRDGDGSPEDYWFNLVYHPLVEVDGRVAGLVTVAAEVTAQVRARREAERLQHAAETARRAAEEANAAKAQFLATMSHELRTPLNAIGGYAAQLEDLGRIQRSQRHLLGLVNEVLNYAKLESGSVRYAMADVAVHEALTDAAGLVLPQARAKGLALRIGECRADLAVRADAEKLRQVLVNLLSNAIKFTGHGSAELSVTCDDAARTVTIRVRDTGIGIPADKLEVIFEPFVQVRADLTRTAEGTGLGLAISRDLARGMGGDLTAESTPGAGSTFTLTLPAA